MANGLSKNLATALARLRGVDRTRPLVTYEPNPLLAWAFDRFFEHIQVEPGAAPVIRLGP